MSNETLLVKIIAILKKYTTIPALLKTTYRHFNFVKITKYLQLENALNSIQIKSGAEHKQLVHLFYITIKPLIIQTILDELNSLKNKYKIYNNIENDILFNVYNNFGTTDIKQYLNKLYDEYIKEYISHGERCVISNMFFFIDREIFWVNTEKKDEYYREINRQLYRIYIYDYINQNNIINTIKHNTKNIINIYT
ncbi:MAG: hypothetical protein PUJ92_04825 [Bacilli bacterium]|nr:hypothetical protein [Bacilli bacterium]MDY5833009.1 hypothetical protein [Candidatus Onthovivens sp.]